MCALSGVLAIALPVPVIVSNFEYYYKEELARQVAEQARQATEEDTAQGNSFTVQIPPPLTCSSADLDQEILELKGISKLNNKQSEVVNHFAKLSPHNTPKTPRRKTETIL